MRNFTFFLCCLIFISCNSSKQTVSLKQWILDNNGQINLVTDSIIQDYHKRNKTDSNWISSSIAITKYAPNILGTLAEKIGDSTDCIVIELIFYKNLNQKKEIMIAAVDSSCLNKIEQTIIETDSTKNFIFGKKTEVL